MKLDFFEQLQKSIANLTDGIPVVIGYANVDDSIAIFMTPGRQETKFQNGDRDVILNFGLLAKTQSQMMAYNSLIAISSYLESRDDIPSGNGSYEFENIEIVDNPTQPVARDERGYWIYEMHLKVKIYIKNGVRI